MKKIYSPEDLDTIESVKFFKEHYETFKPLKNAVVFFENENFIFTDYTPVHAGISAIYENWDGDQIQFSSTNVGYGGRGPSGTLQILRFLGLDDADKSFDKWCYYPGINIAFNQSGKISKVKVSEDAFFESRSHELKSDQLYLNNEVLFVNSLKRKIYFRNPQRVEFEKFLGLIKRSKPVSLEYWLGNESTLENWFRGRDYFANGHSIPFAENEVNLIINGEQYSICCLIHLSELIEVINCTWLFLTGEKLISEKIRYRKEQFYTRNFDIKVGKRRLFDIFSRIDESEIYRCVEIPCQQKDHDHGAF